MMDKRRKIWIPMFTAVLMLLEIFGGSAPVSAKSVRVSVPKKTVQVGSRILLKAKTQRVKYKSSNSSIAFVDRDGYVTGKRPGRAKITISRKGYKARVVTVKVKAVKKNLTLDVAPDEIKLLSAKMQKQEDGHYQYSAVVKNTAKKGVVHKIQYYYQITAGSIDAESEPKPASPATGTSVSVGGAGYIKKEYKKRQVVLTANNIRAGKKSSRVKCEGDYSGKISAMKPFKVVLYTGEAVYTYQAASGTGKLAWSDKDMSGPVISGWIGKKSVYNGEPIWVCYGDRKGIYNFKETVRAVDARDGKVAVSVDTSRINWNREGVYKVYYTARDKAGNKTRAWAKVQVYKPGKAERIADIILASTAKSGSDVKKLRNIYKYITGHCSYVGKSVHCHWRKAAVTGIRNHRGDCYTFYSISRLLCSRAGFPTVMIRRYPFNTGNDHWWNLIYVEGGWYHFDTTPRQRKGYFCLQTDAQLRIYSTGSTFRYGPKRYPKRAVKRISRNPV